MNLLKKIASYVANRLRKDETQLLALGSLLSKQQLLLNTPNLFSHFIWARGLGAFAKRRGERQRVVTGIGTTENEAVQAIRL